MKLVVRWDKMGSEFSYCVWYAKKPQGPWIRHNQIRLTDETIDILRERENIYNTVLYNEYFIDGLNEHTSYSVKVTCVDSYNATRVSGAAPENSLGLKFCITNTDIDFGLLFVGSFSSCTDDSIPVLKYFGTSMISSTLE